MGISQDKKDFTRKAREDGKIKPDFAPGQGSSNMQNGPRRPPFGGGRPGMGGGMNGNRPPMGGGMNGNRPPMGGSMNRSPMGGGRPPFGGNRPPFGGGRPGMGNSFGGSMNQNSQNQQMNNAQKTPQQIEQEKNEKIEKAAKVGFGEIWNFFNQLGKSFKQMNMVDWQKSVNQMFVLSGVMSVISLVISFFKHDIFTLVLGGVSVTALALLGNYLIVRNPKYIKELNAQDDEEEQPEDEEDEEEGYPEDGDEDEDEEEPEDEDLDLFGDDDDELYEDDEDGDDDDDGDDDEEDDDEDDLGKSLFGSPSKSITPVAPVVPKSTPVVKPEGDPAESLTKLDSVDPHMVSRQFIYERMLEAGQQTTPDYQKKTKVPEKSDKFDTMDAIFSDIFSVLGFEDDDKENINEYTDTLLVDYLETPRPKKKFKLEDFDRELTQILRKGYDGQGGDDRKFSRSEFIGRKMITKIFKGTEPMISVTDVLKNNKDFYLNPDNKIPYVLGINDEGKEVKMDLEQAESIIVAGKTRSGKSFTVRQMLTQMMYFNSSNDLNFYIGDVKGPASDYYRLKSPQVKEFESKPLEILNMLKHLVTDVRKEREKIFADKGVIKIDQYHSEYPDNKDMPYIYVVIDEMVALAGQLKTLQNSDKDAPKYKDMYYSYLEQLVTQLPGYGIRLIAVPHRVTNDFLPKTASDNMTFKIAVAADEELLKETLGITKKKFGYSATKKGDLSVLTPLISPDPFYCRSLVPASNNSKSDKLFQFQTDFWNRIDGKEKESKGTQGNNSSGGSKSDEKGDTGLLSELGGGTDNDSQHEFSLKNPDKPDSPAPTSSAASSNSGLNATNGDKGLSFEDILND